MYLLGCVADKKSIRVTHVICIPNLFHQLVSRAAIRLTAFNDLVAQPSPFRTRVTTMPFNQLDLDHQFQQTIEITFLYARHRSPLSKFASACESPCRYP